MLQKFVAPLEVTPNAQRPFTAQFRIDSIGPISIRRTMSMPARIDITEQQVVHSASQRYFLVLPIDGRVRYWHCGHENLLEPGDFALFDGTAPGRIEFYEPNTAYHLVFPPDELRARLPTPANMCGVRAAHNGPFGAVVRALVDDVWAQIESGFPQEYGLAVAKNLLDVIATAYVLQHGKRFHESSSTSARRAHMKRFIEARLRTPEIGAAYIADYFGVTSRYVSMIFEKENETVSAYILRRRLEECAHQLSCPQWDAYSVTDIAGEWCFVNRAHFSRVFKRRFGVSPREYRRLNHRPH